MARFRRFVFPFARPALAHNPFLSVQRSQSAVSCQASLKWAFVLSAGSLPIWNVPLLQAAAPSAPLIWFPNVPGTLSPGKAPAHGALRQVGWHGRGPSAHDPFPTRSRKDLSPGRPQAGRGRSQGAPSGPHRSRTLSGGTDSIKISTRRVVSHGAEEVVNRQMINQFVAGTNPLEVLALTSPGASFASGDPSGMDTSTNTFYLRGFNLTQLGVTVDDIPMGSQMFANVGGATATQLFIQENISRLEASQGAGALDTPSSQTLGGVLRYTTSDPSDHFGTRISQQFGSFNGFRTFARIDSGKLNDTGTKFYGSFLRSDHNLWAGYGYQKAWLGNFKLVQPLSDIGKLTYSFDYSDFSDYSPLGLTKNMERVLGYHAHNFKPDYHKATQWAQCVVTGCMPPGSAGLTPDEVSDVGYQGGQIQRAYLNALKIEVRLFPNVRATTLGYGQVANAWYGGTQPGIVTPEGFPMAEFAQHPNMRRIGFTQTFDIQAGRTNAVKTGLWYQNDYMQTWNDLFADGPAGAHSMFHHLHNDRAAHWAEDRTNTNTFQFFLQDRWTILPGMTFLAGFRSLTQTTAGGTRHDWSSQLTRQGWGLFYSHPANGSLTAAAAFLPHFSYDWRFGADRAHEVYWDIAENMRAYDYNVQFSSNTPWSGLGTASGASGQQVFNQQKSRLKPERTWNYVVGYRYTSAFLTAGVDYYHTDYINRLGGLTSGSALNPVRAYLNLGNETMNGADVVVTVHPLQALGLAKDRWGDVGLTNSFSYNHAAYQNKALPTSNGPLNIKGKLQVFYPQYMYKMNLNYRYRHLTANFNVTYSSSRPLTYTNDTRVPGYWTSELTGTYDFGGLGFARDFQARFGITNLFGGKYFSGIHGGAALTGDDNPILYPAAPRAFFGAVEARF
ncbi:TonB-dependent receptor [Oecophyllibacter saccharovorans]|uniref:TonB-dependent receptor domain-containing protein n=1 Tax=Oecophyllibacter saccharovorans TaxID=2558360 RepID=UPI001143B160|nr:TonB-dependent receptor [Oecophyllibacter saccharovorans]QDH15035.1 TonB-dependent receptor [Oecophyllibacter saccharovorans]